MKVTNDLLGYNNYKIIQDTDYFSFSLDSVLLPNFVTLNKNISKIIDLCTGNAPIPIILSTKTNAKIYGIELQKEIYDMADESIKINNLDKKIFLINDDVKNMNKYFKYGEFDVITVNPPYFKIEKESKLNDNIKKSIARHEIKINLEEIIDISSKYLKNNGVFAMVHRTDRLIEVINCMQKYKIEPKRLQFVYPLNNKNSNMILIEGRKNASPGLKVLEPLIVHNEDGSYKSDILKKFE